MCAACIEYAKNTLNLNEFKSALREMTQEDKEHAEEIARILRDFAGDEVEIKKRLKALNSSRS